MKATHTLAISGRCPVNPEVVDRYRVEVMVADRTLPVEEILAVIEDVTRHPIFQEDLTAELARRLHAQVKTEGMHSGVATICTAGAA